MFTSLIAPHAGAVFCKAGRLIAGLSPASRANLVAALNSPADELPTSVIHRAINSELGHGVIGVSVLARHRQHLCSCPAGGGADHV